VTKLKSKLRTCYGRHYAIVNRYWIPVCRNHNPDLSTFHDLSPGL